MHECTFYLRPDGYSGGTQTAVIVRSKRQERNATTSHMRRQTSCNLPGGGMEMRAGYRLSSGVGGCSTGSVWGGKLRGLELLSASGHKHALEYPRGKPLEANLQQELQ